MTLASSLAYHLSRAESSQRKPTLKSEWLNGCWGGEGSKGGGGSRDVSPRRSAGWIKENHTMKPCRGKIIAGGDRAPHALPWKVALQIEMRVHS